MLRWLRDFFGLSDKQPLSDFTTDTPEDDFDITWVQGKDGELHTLDEIADDEDD